MTRSNELVAVTREALNRMTSSPAGGGDLWLAHSAADDLYVVTVVESVNGARLPVALGKFGALARAEGRVDGQWLRDVPLDAHILHRELVVRPGTAQPLPAFMAHVPNVRDPGSGAYPLITHTVDVPPDALAAGVPTVAGWHVTSDGVWPLDVAVEPELIDVSRLARQWPVDQLQGAQVAIVGLGSIGGVVAQSLAASGVGNLSLVDPDRFLWHNLVRHVLGPEDVGRLKVNALKERIESRWPTTSVTAHSLDVVRDAHLVRSLLDRVDLIVCAADGIAPRRTVSHLARRAGKTAILACVLDDGAVGEVLRLRPGPRFGCLMCQRGALEAAGALDAEADQELDYGTGLSHKPMTAVGPDLWFVAELAAKASVSTVLQGLGHAEHQLPDEHAVLALRTGNNLAGPFGVSHVGKIEWHSASGPLPGCWTCG